MVVRSTNIASFSFTRSQSSISMDKATVTINRELYEKKTTNKQTGKVLVVTNTPVNNPMIMKILQC